MAWLKHLIQSTEGKADKVVGGPWLFNRGAFYIQQAAGPTLASSTTETSLLTGTTGNTLASPTSGTYMTFGVPGTGNADYPGSTLVLTGQTGFSNGLLKQGTMIAWRFFGTIANTSTPNLTIKVGLVNQTTGAFTALAATAATAMSNVSTCLWELTGSLMVVADSATAGEIYAACKFAYGVTGTAIVSPLGDTSSFDTTQSYALDIRATWGTSSASNTMTLNYGMFELVG